MRRLIVSEMVSLDGFFAGPDGGIDWHIVDAEFNDYALGLLNTIDTMLFGRVTYQLMVSYWPTPMALNDDPIIADKMNTIPKVVFSKTLDRVEWGKWNNARLVKGNLAEEVAKLKQQPGKNMVVYGSGQLVAALAESGLIDEYRIFICPVALGGGTPLFKGVTKYVNLKLTGTKTFKTGVIVLSYEPGSS